MKIELHSHTTYSKGRKILVEGVDTPEDMVKQAAKIGLDAIAITDHDTIRGGVEALRFAKKNKKITEKIIVIPGSEVSSADGHILALGIEKDIPKGLPARETIDLIHANGGIAVASHPFDIKSVGLGEKAALCDAVEVFNGVNLERISNWKAKRFAEKNNLNMVSGTDAHSAQMIGYAATRVAAEHNIDSILHAIKKGKTSVSDCNYVPTNIIVDWSVIRLKYSYEYTLNYINNHYKWPKKNIYRRLLPLVKRSPGKIDYLFRGLGYFGIGCAVVYRAIREALRI